MVLQKACQALTGAGPLNRNLRLAGLHAPDRDGRPAGEASAPKAHPLRLSQVCSRPSARYST